MDNRREFFRKGLHALYLPIYDGLCDELPEEWQPYYGLRTIEAQNKLYAQGRTLPGKIVTEAKGGESAHNYGCASDWTLWDAGKPLWLESNNPKWEPLFQACDKLGAESGSTFKRVDCPHVQLRLRVSWKTIGQLLREEGMNSAMEMISTSRI